MIYYNSNQASGKIYGASKMNKIMYGKTQIYPDYIKPDTSFKWKATYSNGSVLSAECDASSAITQNEITKANLVSVEIGDCVSEIGQSAFESYTGLTSCTLSNNITNIGKYAFYSASSITTLILPDKLTSIDYAAFMHCKSLTSIVIPASVTTIKASDGGHSNAFFRCNGLTSIIVLSTTPPTLGSQAFDYTNDCPIYVPAESVDAYKSASGWSIYKSRIQPIQ